MEKGKMYEDFEQVCRNIDERITGEKEKLWEKISSTNDSLDSMNAQSFEDKKSILQLIICFTAEKCRHQSDSAIPSN